jgi:uncharacterized protein
MPVRASCLYEGSVRHRRTGTPSDEFHYPLFMAFLDLDELPELFDGRPLWSARGPAVAWFRRGDYLGDKRTSLREAVTELVKDRSGIELDGPIRLLTHLRYFGHCFNPVSFYYCYDAGDERVRAVVAEVTNTPWGERHAYVLPVADRADGGSAQVLRGQFAKVLHVSPLMSMNHTYDWRLSEPSERLSVHIESLGDDGKRVFDATLSLCRSELTPRTLRKALIRYPALTMRLTARIYTHALRLRLRGATYHPHPGRSPKQRTGTSTGTRSGTADTGTEEIKRRNRR